LIPHIGDKYGPRSLIHSYATDTDDPTEMPRWGRGKQRMLLPPFPNMSNVSNIHELPFLKAKDDMTIFDEVLVKASSKVLTKNRHSDDSPMPLHSVLQLSGNISLGVHHAAHK